MNLLLLYNRPGPDAGPDDLDTLAQASGIAGTLEILGHKVEDLAVPDDVSVFRRLLRDRRDRLIFNLSDPVLGEGRLIALPVLLLEQEGCRYTGCPADALYLTSNKLLAKRLMVLNGIPTPGWIHRQGCREKQEFSGGFIPGRYIIKSIWEHGSAGMSSDSVFAAQSPEEAEERLIREPRGIFAEKFLPGREINIGLLANGDGGWELLPPSEIIYTDSENRNPFLDYSSKWEEDSAAYRSSLRKLDASASDGPLFEKLNSTALACAKLFGLNGYARVDFRLDDLGTPMVMEVNANPCLTPGAGFAAAAEKGGISYKELITRILASPYKGL